MQNVVYTTREERGGGGLYNNISNFIQKSRFVCGDPDQRVILQLRHVSKSEMAD